MSFPRTLAPAIAATLLCASVPALAAVAYDETTSGDLSNVRTAPTVITFVLGDNDVLGSTGWITDDDAYRDYATFVIPENAILTGVWVLPGTSGAEGGDIFFGLQAGSTVTVNPVTYAGQDALLGWNHFSDNAIGTSLIGGALPLAAGAYSFWIQDYNEEEAPYGLRFTLESTVPVPEPETYALMGVGLLLLGMAANRGRRNARAG
ncbi:MAG: PEP-CTERM sorting domain-containing protein [Burkholderiales bacterium]|nr:PEP-CTERM sorting domain-containing protein [Burkholderiales bacterium]